jgi:hypothetical protein
LVVLLAAGAALPFGALRRSERIGTRLLVAAALVVGGGALISGFR